MSVEGQRYPVVEKLAPAYQLSNDILDKHFLNAPETLAQAQTDSFDQFISVAIPKIVESSKIHACRVLDQLWVFILDTPYADKPMHTELNGERRKILPQEILYREMTYGSMVQVPRHYFVFSQNDPTSPSELDIYKSKLVKGMQVNTTSSVGSGGQTGAAKVKRTDRNELMKLAERSASRSAINQTILGHIDKIPNHLDEAYWQKTKQAHDMCRLKPYERDTFKYLISHTFLPSHPLVEVPVMTGTVLDHELDDLAKNQDCMYDIGGCFLFTGRQRPMLMTYRFQFDYPYMFSDAELEIRSSHHVHKYRTSSTSKLHFVDGGKKLCHGRFVWQVPQIRFRKLKLPLNKPFQALGVTEDAAIWDLVDFILTHYFREEKDIPRERIRELIQHSFEYQTHESEKYRTQEEVWIYFGKNRQGEDENQFVQNCVPGEQQPLAAATVVKNAQSTLERRKAYYQQQLINQGKSPMEGEELRAWEVEEQRKEWMRLGRSGICKEILPHVNSEPRKEPQFALIKAFHLAYYVAKLALRRVREYTKQPDDFIPLDCRDQNSKRIVELVQDYVHNKALRGILTNHLKLGRQENGAAGRKLKHPLDSKNDLDHKRPTNALHKCFARGHFKVNNNPALAGGRKFPGQEQQRRAAAAAANGSRKNPMDKTGITQPMNSVNINSIYSSQMRLSGNVSNASADSTARMILDDFGVLCFVETPDNPSAGLTKPLALLARISTPPLSYDLVIETILTRFPVDPIDDVVRSIIDSVPSTERRVLISMNYKFIGMCTETVAVEISDFLKSNRFQLGGESYISVANPRLTRELSILMEGGRICRPLLNAKKLWRLFMTSSATDPRPLIKTISWTQMVKGGFIDNIDKHEEKSDCLIATTLGDMIKLAQAYSIEDLVTLPYTHVEISLLLSLGFCASQIPFLTQNQGPRNTYSAAMGKQGMSVAFTNFLARLDPMCHSLCYANRPLVFTMPKKLFRAQDLSESMLFVVAVMCYGGKTMEDAIQISQSAYDRGLGRSIQLTTSGLIEKRHLSSSIALEQFGVPDPKTTLALKTKSSAKLDIDGFPCPGEYLTTDDLMIGRTAPLDESVLGDLTESGNRLLRVDNSYETQSKNSGLVKRVMLTVNDKGERKSRVQTEKLNRLEIGDKLSSDHAQKGTISEIIADEDMPYEPGGETIDMLFGPHGIPSRMTVGHMCEMFGSNVAVLCAQRMDGTAFSDAWKECMIYAQMDRKTWMSVMQVGGLNESQVDTSDLPEDGDRILMMGRFMRSIGFDEKSCTQLYDGRSGELIGSYGSKQRGAGVIFKGRLAMKKLIHLANDKLHCRASTGQRNVNTRQPVEGGRRNGGYRIAGMEIDVACAHGASEFLMERFCLASDPHITYICRRCKNVALAIPSKNYTFCKKCGTGAYVGKSLMTFAAKLLFDLLRTAGLSVKLQGTPVE